MEKSIKLLRTQSLLKELVPEAISSLNDTNLNNISVVDVDCSKGKYHAIVYLDASFATDQEQKYILSHLKKANPFLQNYCKQAEGWFRAPSFKFIFDNSLEHQNKMDDLFKQISKELDKNG